MAMCVRPKVKSVLFAAATGLSLLGCGNVFMNSDSDSASEEEPVVPTEPKTFEGFIGGVFEVTVDNQKYLDMEDFYTQEVAKLPTKVAAAGYDPSWTASFDAEVGLSDLWRSMTVYISPTDNQGYQGQTYVESNGGFSITLPPAALNKVYRIRANKRIGITLTRGELVKKLCYNFSAVEMSAPFDDASLPIIIQTFVTTITAYSCNESSGSTGVKIPPTPHQATTLKIGLTKADVTRILGVNGMFAESPMTWCWAHRPAVDSPCLADKADTNCDCHVSFDPDGLISSLESIAPGYLENP